MTHDDRNANSREGEALAVAFATFLKACFVYPENNVRVQESTEQCLQAIGRASVRGESIVLKAGGRKVVCMGAELESPLPPMVDWMKATMRGAALAGVEFAQDLRREDLLGFARRLRESFRKGRRNPSFEALWSEPIRGFRLIEPRFRGRFSTDADTADAADYPDSPATQSVRFARSVDHHPGIVEKLQGLQRAIAQRSAGESHEIDVVAQVVNLLPEDVRNNPVALIKTVESILVLATDQLAAKREEELRDLDFRRLLVRICQTFFVREDQERLGDAKQDEAESGPRGHAGDDLVADDLDALLREIKQMSAATAEVRLEESPAEQLGVCVHQLLSSDHDDHLLNLKPRLVALLATPGPEELGVVRECIAPAGSNAPRPERLVGFLADAGLSAVLRSTLVLPREALIRDFPHNFCLFIDTLQEGDPQAHHQLADVAAAVGRERILQRAGALIKDGLLAEGRARKVLAEPQPALLPLAEIIVQHGTKAQKGLVAQFVRRLDLAVPAAAALTIDEQDLPAGFVLALCQSAQDPVASQGANKTAANLLKQLITERATDPTEVQRRVYAVHSLRRLWSEDVAAFLQSAARRGPFAPMKLAKPIRNAARELLREQANR